MSHQLDALPIVAPGHGRQRRSTETRAGPEPWPVLAATRQAAGSVDGSSRDCVQWPGILRGCRAARRRGPERRTPRYSRSGFPGDGVRRRIINAMRYPRRTVATLMVGLVAPLALAACGATAPHRHNELNASTARAPTTYQAIGSASSGSTTSSWSSSVTVSRLAGTSRQRAHITVNYECSPSGPTCRWSSEASQTGSGTCPAIFDVAHSIWTGPAEPTPGTDHASVAFQPMHGVARPHVCVYVND